MLFFIFSVGAWQSVLEQKTRSATFVLICTGTTSMDSSVRLDAGACGFFEMGRFFCLDAADLGLSAFFSEFECWLEGPANLIVALGGRGFVFAMGA